MRLILSRICSSQHNLTLWLITILQPFLDYNIIYCIKDFVCDFSRFIKGYFLTDKFMCFYGVFSLSTSFWDC